MVAETRKGSAAATANPLSLTWLRGLDLNQRPLGYECETAMTGNPLISREKHVTATGSPLSVDTSFLLLLRPVSGCCGSKMGADNTGSIPQTGSARRTVNPLVVTFEALA